MNKIYHYIALGVIFTCIAGFLAPTLSTSAAKTKSVVFDQYQEETVPGLSQSLRGIDVIFNCPGENNSPDHGPLFQFSASREGPTATGNFGLLAAPGAASGDSGTVTDAKITPKKFKLEGTIIDKGFGHDIICGKPLPTTFVLEGPCGIDVNVNLKVSNGINGTFRGDVVCTT
jgi:hypothetical protein